jgi:hypothetical protein
LCQAWLSNLNSILRKYNICNEYLFTKYFTEWSREIIVSFISHVTGTDNAIRLLTFDIRQLEPIEL